MKQLLSVILLAVLFSGFVNAQSQWISVGGNLALPIGDWSNSANIGFGGTATYERSFAPNIVGQVYAGYLSFGGKDSGLDGWSYSYSMIPIMAGVKYFFQPGKGLYANGLLGVHILSVDITVPAEYQGFGAFGGSSSDTKFGLGVGAGYEMPMGKNALDLSANFMLVGDANYIGARVAYKFGM